MIGADSREQAKRNSSHHKISVIDLGQAKICPSLHGSDDHKSFRRPLNGSDWFDVNECQFWRENLKDPWVVSGGHRYLADRREVALAES